MKKIGCVQHDCDDCKAREAAQALDLLTNDQIDDLQEAAFQRLRDTGYSGGPDGSTWDRASARAIEAHYRTLLAPQAVEPVNQWREAVLNELAISCIDYPISTPPSDILKGLIAVREAMAKDQTINDPNLSIEQKELIAKLRVYCTELRTRPIPLVQIIPLLQKAADMLEVGQRKAS